MRKNILIAGLLATAALAVAVPQNFARRSFGIKAGVVVLESMRTAGFPANYAPHVFGNFDANVRIKPARLSLYNPAPESIWTAAARTRWTALAGSAPAIGERTSKRDAVYWEVSLSAASDRQISNYDILLVPAFGLVQLNSAEREKLRRFCDKGGVLWVDTNGSTTFDVVNNFPVPFTLNAPFGSASVDFQHPLMSFPHALSPADLIQMEGQPGTRGISAAIVPGAIEPIEATIAPDFMRFQTVVEDPLGPTISVARLGDGYMVVTTRAVSKSLNHDPNLGINSNVGAVATTPLFDRASDSAAKFLLNMVYLTSGFAQSGGGSHRSSSSPIDLEPPLLKTFDTTNSSFFTPFTPPGNAYVPPALYKGLMIVSSGDKVYALDANPREDLDGDGDPDDGVRDLSLGENCDVVWVSTVLNGPVSAPACSEIASGGVKDQALVVTASGDLVCFNVFPTDPRVPNPPAYLVSPPTGSSSAATLLPNSPAIHDGLVFVSDSQDSGLSVVGRVWVADARSGSLLSGATGFSVGGVGTQLIPQISSGPTVGWLPIADNSGGVDRVVYVPTLPNPTFGGPNSNAGVYSFWFGVKGERPSSYSISGNQLVVATRASSSGLSILMPGSSSYGVKITLLHKNGDPYSTAEMDAIFTGAVSQSGGILAFGLEGGVITLEDGIGVRLDYTIDWGTGAPSASSQILRGFMVFPDDTNRKRRVLGNLALSAQGTLHAVLADPTGGKGGALFSMREEGRGNFRVTNRYEMFQEFSTILNQSAAVTYKETLLDTDPLQNFGPLGGRFQNLAFSSAPAVANGTVYCMAKANKGFIPITILMAFKSEPEVAEVKVGELSNGFVLLQPDIGRSANKATPEVFSTLQASQYVYEKEPGAESGMIRIENLCSTSRGPMLNTMSLSQPLIIRRVGQPDLSIDPAANSSKWSPLLWYSVSYGERTTAPPVVSGGSVFFSGSSALPSIISDEPVFPPVFTGLVTAVSGDISPTDPFLYTVPERPWQKQLWRLKGNSFPDDIVVNPDFLWPQTAGVRSFNDWRIRLFQTTLGTSPESYGVVGGDGAVAAWSSRGVWGFNKADFLVADEGRLVRVDGSGNALWSSDSTIANGATVDNGAAGEIKPLVRPTKAYPLGNRQLVVVDTGGNRIAKLDLTGREIRSIAGFRLDPAHTPDGMDINETTELRTPKDVISFTTIENAGSNPFFGASPTEFWTHYFIADSGNKRLIEIVDRFDYDPIRGQIGAVKQYRKANGSFESAVGMLYWHSPKSLSGGKFDYNSLARVYVPSTGRYVFAAGLGNTMPTRADTGLDAPTTTTLRSSEDGNGGIIIFDGASSRIINEVQVPIIGQNVFYNETTGSFSSPIRPAHTKKLSSLTSLTMRNVLSGGQTKIAVMFTDATGVYEISLFSSSPDVWRVEWMLTRETYKAMRRGFGNRPTTANPSDFRPTYARRLESGDVLVVNGYVGTFRRTDTTFPWVGFTGEVLELDGRIFNGFIPDGFSFVKENMGFKSLSVRFSLPPVEGARGIVLPVFADRR